MTRAQFIQSYADLVKAGRRRKYPDMRPSEEAVSRISDEKSAARHWRKCRASLAPMTVAQWEATQGPHLVTRPN